MLDEERQEELIELIFRMQNVSNQFYTNAVALGNHPFIELTGLINEYITICEQNVTAGNDYTTANIHTGVPLIVAPHNVDYIEEKLSCIFGSLVKIKFQDGGEQ